MGTGEIGPLQTASLWMVTQNRRLKKKTDPPLNTEMQKHDDPGGVIYLWLTVEDIHPQTFIRFTEDLREKWKKKQPNSKILNHKICCC